MGNGVYLLYSILILPVMVLLAKRVFGSLAGPAAQIVVGLAALSVLARSIGILRWLAALWPGQRCLAAQSVPADAGPCHPGADCRGRKGAVGMDARRWRVRSGRARCLSTWLAVYCPAGIASHPILVEHAEQAEHFGIGGCELAQIGRQWLL